VGIFGIRLGGSGSNVFLAWRVLNRMWLKNDFGRFLIMGNFTFFLFFGHGFLCFLRPRLVIMGLLAQRRSSTIIHPESLIGTFKTNQYVVVKTGLIRSR
jgi:hypothetical protein